MTIRFELNSYLECAKLDQSLGDEKSIYDHLKENLQFKNGSVTRNQFNKKYSARGWLGRKFIAIPATVWSAVIKTIYHLAKAVLIGIPKAFSDKGRYLIAQFFNVARDFQEAYGRLTSLFNDRYGQFHIQESQFQKTCYELSLNKNECKPVSPPYSSNGNGDSSSDSTKEDDCIAVNASDDLQSQKKSLLKSFHSTGGNYSFRGTKIIGNAPDELKKDREFVLEICKKDGWAFEYAANELRNDKEIVLEILSVGGGRTAIHFASDELKSDKDFILRAVKINGAGVFEHADDELKSDKTFVTQLCHIDPFSFQYANKKLQDNEDVALIVIKSGSLASGYVSERIAKKYNIETFPW